jgi:hypothetical protein
MVVAEERRAKGSRVSHAAQSLLRVLTRKPFFEHRFLGQVQELFGHSGTDGATDITASLWLSSVFDRMPDEWRDKAGSRACAALVEQFDACPTPTEVRTLLCDALLTVQQLSAAKLIERAQIFFAFPPVSQDVADRWVERVIFTTVTRMGREHFSFVSSDAWKRELCETILGEDSAMKAYQVRTVEPLQASRRDLRSLVVNHG